MVTEVPSANLAAEATDDCDGDVEYEDWTDSSSSECDDSSDSDCELSFVTFVHDAARVWLVFSVSVQIKKIEYRIEIDN